MKRRTVLRAAAGALLCGQAGRAQAPQSVQLEELTHAEVKALEVQVLVLPIGSCEPHGYHLPYINDTQTVGMVAVRAAAQARESGAKVLVLPVMPYGVNVNLVSVPLAQSIRPATMMAFVKDVVDTAAQQGIRKILIVNGHGGNQTTLASTLRELHAAYPRVFVALTYTGELWTGSTAKLFPRPGAAGHASEVETAIALALYPEKVRMEQAVAARQGTLKLPIPAYVTFVSPWKPLTDTTGSGDPRPARAEDGRKVVEAMVERLSRFIVDLSKAEMTETFPY